MKFKSFCFKRGLKVTKEIFPASTDARFIREVIISIQSFFLYFKNFASIKKKIGITAFGFSPLNNTPILLHDHNEFVNEEVFLRGIDVLYKVVIDMANS